MAWVAQPTGKRGRQPVYSDAAVQTCLTMKVPFGMALPQTTGFVESLLCLIGLEWEVPDFSILNFEMASARHVPAPRVAEMNAVKTLAGTDKGRLFGHVRPTSIEGIDSTVWRCSILWPSRDQGR